MISVDTKSKWASGVTRSVSFLSVPLPLAPSHLLSSEQFLILPEPTYLYLISLLSFSLSFSKELSPQDVCIPDFRAPFNPEACCPTLLKLFSVPHGGFAVTSGFTRSTGIFYSSLSLTLWAALGWTSHSLFLSLLGPWFSLGCCFSFSAPPLQNIYVFRCLGTNAELSFLPTVSPKEVSSCSIVLLIKNQQGSHIGISSESYTCLIPPLGFLLDVLYTTDWDWNLDPSLPPLPSQYHHHLLCCLSR